MTLEFFEFLQNRSFLGMDHDRLIAIKSGGQNLRQLTDFCRELASKGITNEFDDDDDILYGGSDTEFHHPFEVKDKPLPNPMLRSGVQAEILTPAMKSACMSHRMIEFPVSSGNAHRVTEVHVDPMKELLAIEDAKIESAKMESAKMESVKIESAKIEAIVGKEDTETKVAKVAKTEPIEPAEPGELKKPFQKYYINVFC
jgi:hypothetical protein